MKFPETLTQAYHAGVICAMAHNKFTKEQLPTFLECAVRPYALRELFGERRWQIMKSRVAFRERIELYESLSYQLSTPKILMGTSIDFALGYIRSYDKSKLKKQLDKQRLEAATTYQHTRFHK